MAHRRRSLLPFLRDTRGATPARWAMIMGGVAVVCVIGTHALDLAVRNGALPQLAARNGNRDLAAAMQRLPQSTVTTTQQTVAGIDYTATATIPAAGGVVHLDPCTGRLK